MAAPNSGPTSRKFTNDDVLRCFDEENRRHVGKIELSSAEITKILNSRVLDDEQVTRQAVKNRLDEMEGEQLVKNEHGRSHLYTRKNDLDRLFREPESDTSPAPGAIPAVGLMSRTTIQVEESTKEMLRENRLPHESNYNETIERLCGEHTVPFVTEQDVRSIVAEMVVREALE